MFNNKVVLVTGGATGIGKSTIIEFAQAGANVIINYNNSQKEAETLKREIETNYNVECLCIKCDISNELEIKNMIDEIISKFNKIDILVNNAGIAIDTLYENKTKDNFMKTLEVNLVGTFLVSKYVAEHMLKNKYGKIINVSSTNGIDTPNPMCLDYDASKAGIISLTHNLAIQLSPYVNVNCVAPGWIATPNEIKDVDEEYLKLEAEKIFLKRIGQPDEVAKTIKFLSSDDASYINNAVIRIDGGQKNGCM